MAFSSGSFILAGTAIAIAGVGLYVWDTRGSKLFESSSTSPEFTPTQNAGKSKKHKRGGNRKTKRH